MELLGPVSKILPLKATTQTATSSTIDRRRMAKYPTIRPHSRSTQCLLLSYSTTKSTTPKHIVLKQRKND